jgi:hypothetical protein
MFLTFMWHIGKASYWIVRFFRLEEAADFTSIWRIFRTKTSGTAQVNHPPESGAVLDMSLPGHVFSARRFDRRVPGGC